MVDNKSSHKSYHLDPLKKLRIPRWSDGYKAHKTYKGFKIVFYKEIKAASPRNSSSQLTSTATLRRILLLF